MSKQTNTLFKEIEPYIELHRDRVTGIAWVENSKSGKQHSAHPYIFASFSVESWKSLGHWGRRDTTVECRGYIYNISKCVVTNEYDAISARFCQCGALHNIPPEFRITTDHTPVCKMIVLGKREGRAGHLRSTYTRRTDVLVRISGLSGSYSLDLIDERFNERGDLYRIAFASSWDIIWGAYEYLRQAPAEVVQAAIEHSLE